MRDPEVGTRHSAIDPAWSPSVYFYQFPDRSWITRFTGQYLPALPLDPNWFPADRRRSFVAPRPSEIKAKAAGRHGLT